MTVIRPNSVSGITSITAQANEINVFRSNGTLAGLNLNGVNFNTTAGVSTLAALNVTGNVDIAGVLTYQDVTNVDSIGIITARNGIDVTGNITASGTIETTGSELKITGAEPRLTFTDTDNNPDFQIWANAQRFSIYDNTNNVTRLRIDSSGRIGIGDDSPDRELVVKNASSNCTIKIEAKNTHTSQLFFSDTDAENVARISVFHGSGQSTSNKLVIDTGGSPRMTIQPDGKIGIGRVDPVNFVDIARGQDEENILVVRGADNTSEYGAIGISGSHYYITGGGAGSTSTGIMFRTALSGNETNRLEITSSGHVEPATDNTYNFGSLTKRWANLYTADLNLSNEGKVNDVDGTWGQYTIQEGEDNLYLINKRSGKKYKFLLQEVS
tara:strand:+ start:448 stop:1599 length:1152 start_codon:yes stop_codon:yes gene_type:complete